MAELTRLGRYQLRRVLGRGAMGVVYEGHDPTLNRRVAIKTILKNAAIDPETARGYSAQFAREAQAAGRLNHPNIVQVHDFAEEGEVAYLVMEFIQGRELRSFFEAKEKFEPAEVVRVMGELLDALDFAHEAGVIHRDVKPANVMMDAQRRVKLADFGVARIQESERSAAGTMVGTPAFMSPEQIQGGKIDRRTDIFSAGVVLYQLLTGEQPFTGQGAWTVAKKIMQDDPPLPSTVVKSVSPVFDDIVNKALAKTPAQRFSSAKEFAGALRAALAPAQQSLPPSTPAIPAMKSKTQASEAEVEFWRSIQNSTDPEELEFYLEQFPEGTYAPLARHKIAKLREPLEAAKKEAEEKARAEEEARARQEAEERARREAEEAARRQAEEKARQEAAAEAARREAEARARREAEARARREAEERARREATEKALREAQEKAKREAEERARQAQALAKLKQQQEAAARAKVAVDPEATVAIGRAAPAAPKAPPPPPSPAAPVQPKKSFAIPAAVVVIVVLAGALGYFMFGRTPAPVPAPVAEAPKPAAPAVDVEKIRRETEERVRKEYADKAAAEKAAMEKAIAEKAAAEKAAAEKVAAAKTAAEKAAAEKAAGKATADRMAAEKAAAEKAAKLEAERAATAKAAAEKLAAEKAAAEKAAAQKAAAAPAARGAMPAVGDQWIYEARTLSGAARTSRISVSVASVSGASIREVVRRGGQGEAAYTHQPGAYILGWGAGIANFSPYLGGLQGLSVGQRWSDVGFKEFGTCSSNPSVTCSVSARVEARERVTVPAGAFDALKVVVDVRAPSASGAAAGGVHVQDTLWFSEAVRRVVKYQGRVLQGSAWPEPGVDMELVSYVPAGSAPPAAATKPEPAAKAETPAPAEVPKSEAPKAPAQVASAAPTPVAAARKPGWPVAGDRLTFEAREANRPEQRYEIEVDVLSVSPSGIQESYRASNGRGFTYLHKPGAYVIGGFPGIALFSPYLRAFQDIQPGQSWSSIPFERFGGCSSDPGVICTLNATVAGRERVTTKAGSFDAWKVEVQQYVKTPGPSRQYRLYFWYADDVGRLVKFQGRVFSGGGGAGTPDMDVELTKFTPAGSK